MLAGDNLQDRTTKEEEVSPRCQACRSTDLVARPVEKYHYRESGLMNVWLYGGGVIESVCRACGHKSIAIQMEPQLLQVIAMRLLMRPGVLRGAELRYLRKTCELTQEVLAKRLNVRRATIANWEGGEIGKSDRGGVLYVRMVLLVEFLSFIASPENRFLSDAHVKTLKSFAGNLTEEFKRFFLTRYKKSVEVRKTDDEWQPCLEAA